MKRTGFNQWISATLACTLLLFAIPPHLGHGEAQSHSSLEHIQNAVNENASKLYIYKDYASGLNNFTQKSFMADKTGYKPVAMMENHGDSYSGTSAIAVTVNLKDHPWAGYYFQNGALPMGASEPLLSFGDHEAGLDLTGATKLVFHARSDEAGARVEFFMGGLGWWEAPYRDSIGTLSLGYITLTPEWKRYEIPLKRNDLSHIGGGFGFVTNDRENRYKSSVTFYMDEIYYEFDNPVDTPLFLASYAPIIDNTDDYVINNFAYLYDNALACLALLYGNQQNEAKRIADAICYALENDRTFTDGRLRNAYMEGNPKSPPGWYSPLGKEYARMPGFYDAKDGKWYEDFYANSTSAGNMAWAILALCEMHKALPSSTAYLDAAKAAANFILPLSHPSGGFTAGYEGFDDGQVKLTYLSTEHNIDLIAAFEALAKLTAGEEATLYKNASDHAKAFVEAMYDEEKGCFYTGTGNDGVTISKDVLPLDTNTWGLLCLYPRGFEKGSRVLSFIEESFTVDGGYDFNNDKDGIWFEGTAQAALCYLMVGDTEKYGEIMRLLTENMDETGAIAAANKRGITTGFMVSGTEIPWLYGNRTHLGATAWLAFAQMGINPFLP